MVEASLGPQLDLAVLDVLGQDRLVEVTRSLVWMLVAEDAGHVRSEEALDLARRFGVVVGGSPTITDMPTTLGAETRTYLAAVLLDFATADDEGGADDLGAVLARGPPRRSGRRPAAADRRRAGPGRPRDGPGAGVGGLPAGGALMRRLVARAVDRGGLPPDDVLGLLLPMFRTVQGLHETGRVAPLRGLAALDDDGDDPVTIDVSLAGPPVRNRSAIAAAEITGAVEVEHQESAENTVRIVAGWQRWEHLVGHHDELTDIASLGELFVALVCGLDLADEDDAALLQRHRNNLFALAPGLHPVLATVASSMIAPDRRRRAQDLADVLIAARVVPGPAGGLRPGPRAGRPEREQSRQSRRRPVSSRAPARPALRRLPTQPAAALPAHRPHPQPHRGVGAAGARRAAHPGVAAVHLGRSGVLAAAGREGARRRLARPLGRRPVRRRRRSTR